MTDLHVTDVNFRCVAFKGVTNGISIEHPLKVQVPTAKFERLRALLDRTDVYPTPPVAGPRGVVTQGSQELQELSICSAPARAPAEGPKHLEGLEHLEDVAISLGPSLTRNNHQAVLEHSQRRAVPMPFALRGSGSPQVSERLYEASRVGVKRPGRVDRELETVHETVDVSDVSDVSVGFSVDFRVKTRDLVSIPDITWSAPGIAWMTTDLSGLRVDGTEPKRWFT